MRLLRVAQKIGKFSDFKSSNVFLCRSIRKDIKNVFMSIRAYLGVSPEELISYKGTIKEKVKHFLFIFSF